MKIIIDRPENAFDAFEHISAEVKASPLDPSPEAVAGKPHPVSEEQVCSCESYHGIFFTYIKPFVNLTYHTEQPQINRLTEWSKNCAALLKVVETMTQDERRQMLGRCAPSARSGSEHAPLPPTSPCLSATPHAPEQLVRMRLRLPRPPKC